MIHALADISAYISLTDKLMKYTYALVSVYILLGHSKNSSSCLMQQLKALYCILKHALVIAIDGLNLSVIYMFEKLIYST